MVRFPKRGTRCILSARRNEVNDWGKKRLDFEFQGISGPNRGSSRLLFLVVGAVIFLGIFYLYQVNSVTVTGYQIQELEKKLEEAKKDNEKMMIESAQLKSMYNIEQVVKEFELVGSKEVSYLETGDEALAMR